MFSSSFVFLDNYGNDITKTITGFDAAVTSALDEAAARGLAIAKGLTYGALANSLLIQSPEPNERIIRWAKANFYGLFVENGRDGFGVKNKKRKKRKALCFYVNGAFVFAARVKAAEPRPFLAPAAQALEELAPAIFDAAISKAIQ